MATPKNLKIIGGLLMAASLIGFLWACFSGVSYKSAFYVMIAAYFADMYGQSLFYNAHKKDITRHLSEVDANVDRIKESMDGAFEEIRRLRAENESLKRHIRDE